MVSHIPSSIHYHGTYNSTSQNSNMHVGYGCSNIDIHLQGCDLLLRQSTDISHPSICISIDTHVTRHFNLVWTKKWICQLPISHDNCAQLTSNWLQTMNVDMSVNN